jgi:hypothetical protein
VASRNGRRRNGNSENITRAVTEVSERMTLLVREEIELAKAEVTQKVTTIAKGAAAVGAGAVFGVFAVMFGLATIAWGINAIVVRGAGDIWIGFMGVTVGLTAFMLAAFIFAWRKLRVGPPTPDMAIDEAKKIRETVAVTSAEPGTVTPAVTQTATPTKAVAPGGTETVTPTETDTVS